MAEQLNFYQLLKLDTRTSLSPQEVKAAYRRALLQYHPDKSKRVSEDKSTTVDASITVDDIALAYKTLSEPGLRAEYDRWLQSYAEATSNFLVNRPHQTGLETVDLDDLDFDPETSLWSRNCRCGDENGFILSETELEKNIEDGEVIVGCKGCSLWLRVLFSVEE